MSAGKKAGGASPSVGGDHIGALPDALLHHVISFLPARQAVQTCVLARRWVHLWKSAPGVRIADADAGDFDEVRVFVDNLLLLRGCSRVDTLELKFTRVSIDMARVRLWIQHAMLYCKLRVLMLDTYEIRTSFEQDNPPLVSDHLTRVEIRGIVFRDDDFLDFSRCPSLQDLHLAMCGFANTKSISSRSLKRLTITEGSFLSRTRIRAQNLVSLKLHVDWGRTPVLERMPSLVSAVVHIGQTCFDICGRTYDGDCGDESCHGCIKDDSSSVLLQGLSEAKRLHLTARLPKMYVIRRDLKRCPTFSRLKILVLNQYWCVPDIHPLKCILEHSPVVEELCLLLFSQGPKYNVQMEGNLNGKELSSAMSAHLKRLEIKCEMVDERVLKVLTFLSKFNICSSFKEKKV
ncbi:unnamed protein product [Urochloa decumbens]|uniref:F-box domain-containing protein n=1 Tax=Urochloa decumbens TaxID=240449 RepID=A0ABC8Y635_9POAL